VPSQRPRRLNESGKIGRLLDEGWQDIVNYTSILTNYRSSRANSLGARSDFPEWGRVFDLRDSGLL